MVAVAVNTFREAVRDRVLYNLVFFALMMIGAAILVGQISIGIEQLVIVNLGLSAISLFGLVMAIFIGVGLGLQGDRKADTLQPAGEADSPLGISGREVCRLAADAGGEHGVHDAGSGGRFFLRGRACRAADVSILVAVYFILLEFALVTALALFFSCFSSPMLSTLFTLGIYITGVFAQDIHGVGEFSQNPAIAGMARRNLFPDSEFPQFKRIAAAAHGDAIPFSLIWQNTLYAVLYAACF